MTEIDKIIVNGNIRTMDENQPFAEAVAISGNKIFKVGTTADIKKLASDNTEVFDAVGMTVFPGFQDTHLHIFDTGNEFHHAAVLYECETVEQLQQVMRKFAEEHPENEVIRGTGMESSIFTPDVINRFHLDEVISDRPVYIMANDGHNAIYNSFACEKYGVVKGAQDPENGHFVLDDKGVPTGFLVEDAIWWGVAQLPKATDEDAIEGILFGAEFANIHGITGVLDAMVSRRNLRLAQQLEEEGRLNVRTASTYKVKPSDKNVSAIVDALKDLRNTYNSDMLKMHSAKFFLDGVFENKTAALLEPDLQGDNAPVMFEWDHFRDLIVAFDKERFQCHIHVIGDKATRFGLDAVETALEENGDWGGLHQFAHLQLVHPDDQPRFAELKAVVNVQPLWAVYDKEVEEVLDQERIDNIYPFASMIRSGAPYAISSDWGVTTLNPFEIMQVAVTRTPNINPDNIPAFNPSETLTVDEVVKGYTTEAAAAAWRLDSTGTITEGKFADIIIIDQDVYQIPVQEIHNTKVLLTMVDGRIVHQIS